MNTQTRQPFTTRFGSPASPLADLQRFRPCQRVEYRTAYDEWVPGVILSRASWSDNHMAWTLPVWNPATGFVASVANAADLREVTR